MQSLISPRVERGDLVRLVSPAIWPGSGWLRESIAILEGWGLRVDIAPHALDRHGFCAGRDEDGLSDLNDAFADPAVRAIVTTTGGAGAYRIADFLDFDLVRADPKPLVGFSDITHVHLALWQHCRLGGIHGALAGSTAQAGVRQLLMTTAPLTVHRRGRGSVRSRVRTRTIIRTARRSQPHRGGNLDRYQAA
jgi:muramoyltetrapeptide carboxypeptidase